MIHQSTTQSGQRPDSRREFLRKTGTGFGTVALASLMGRDRQAIAAESRKIEIDPLRPMQVRAPHFPPKARNVIFLFMSGGPSQIQTFDYKPELHRLDGTELPEDIQRRNDTIGGVFKLCTNRLMAPQVDWQPHGQSRLWISDLLSHTAKHADDLCVIKTMQGESANHGPACYLMNTGAIVQGRPSLGSWVTYGLGSENQNLPGFVVLFKVGALGGASNWGQGFLPTAFQGTRLAHRGDLVRFLKSASASPAIQRSTLSTLQQLNRRHAQTRTHVNDLEGRIASYELAYRLQSEAMNIGDLSGETRSTLASYGIDEDPTDEFARMCLLSRRMVEKGVRFVQVYSAYDKSGWDGHFRCDDNHRANALQTDKPVAALLADLKQRGLFDETLVIWGGEFGRTPMSQGKTGRNHNPYAFSLWMAGGGVKGGRSLGMTDDFGLYPETRPYSIRDLHATILAALGMEADDLIFNHNGRPERLTGVEATAEVIPGVLD